MRTKAFLLALIMLLSLLPLAALAEPGRPLYAVQGDDGKWGYIDSQGQWAIEPQFDEAVDFNGDYACVTVYLTEEELAEREKEKEEKAEKKNEEDEEGEREERLSFDEWEDMDTGDVMAPTTDGIIDVTGAWVLEPEYEISSLSDSSEWTGNYYRVSQWEDSARITGWFNLTNGYFSGLLYERVYAGETDSADGNALLVTRAEDGAWAYLDSLTGEELIPFQEEWEKAGAFAEGYVLAKKGSKTALLDVDGNQIQPQDGLAIPRDAQVSQGLIQVKDAESGLVGYMNTAGETVIAPAYSWADDFKEGVACVQFPEGDYGHIDLAGQTLYRGASQRYSFSKGLAALLDDEEADTLVFIGTDGAEAFRITVEGLYSVGEFGENGVAVYQAMKETMHYNAVWDYDYYTFRAHGLINAEGELLTEPVFYIAGLIDDAPLYSEGLAAISDLETLLVGYIDAQGQWVIQPQYDEAWAFQDGMAKVRQGDTELFIDTEGNVLFSCAWQ